MEKFEKLSTELFGEVSIPRDHLEKMCALLNRQECDVISKLLGINGKEVTKITEIAAEYRVSPRRILQIRSKAVYRLVRWYKNWLLEKNEA